MTKALLPRRALLICFFVCSFCSAASAFVAGIVPHHDVASDMIARFYSEISKISPKPERIFLIAPDHFYAGRNKVTFSGEFGLHDRALQVLSSSEALTRQDKIFKNEHGVTVHIPYIKKTFGDVPIYPILVRNEAPDIQLLMLRKKMVPLLKSAILILSMDFSHYKTSAEAKSEDVRSIAAIQNFKFGELPFIDVDCPRGSALFLAVCKQMGNMDSRVLDNTNSVEILKIDFKECTSYATIIFQ